MLNLIQEKLTEACTEEKRATTKSTQQYWFGRITVLQELLHKQHDETLQFTVNPEECISFECMDKEN